MKQEIKRRLCSDPVGLKQPLFAILCATFAITTNAVRADDVGVTVPDPATIRNATAQCVRNPQQPPSRIVGLSDPNTLDPRVIDLIADTGVNWVRAEFHWSRIEPTPGGEFRWDEYDRMVDRFNRAGINILAILTYPPGWAQDRWQDLDSGFERFAKAAVTRYASQGVQLWEVFNEPNLTGYGWLTHAHDAAENLDIYTLLLARANRALRENARDGFLVLGGLASDQHRGLSAERTMDEIYGYGAADCFDIFAYHPYGYQGMFDQARARIDGILKKHGDTGKPVWFNEYSWTDHAEMDLSNNATAANNPMINAFTQLEGNTDAFFWFSAKDFSTRLGAPNFGLATYDFKRRPSFETFKEIVEQIE